MLSSGRLHALAFTRRLAAIVPIDAQILSLRHTQQVRSLLRVPKMAHSTASRASPPTTTAKTPFNKGTAMGEHGTIHFGPFEVTEQVFLTTRHSFALVNLKPLTRGHVLVCPLRAHRRLTDLSAAETADLFATVQLAQRMLARAYFGSGAPDGGSFTVAVQDGREAGQTVPHVHVHVIPRLRIEEREGEAERREAPDRVYVDMAGEKGNVGGALWDAAAAGGRPTPGGGLPRIEDEERLARTEGEMNEEAGRYRRLLEEMGV